MRFAHVGTRARMVNEGLFIQKQNKMEIFQFVSAVCGYHIYKDIWEPSVGENVLHIESLVISSTNLLSKCSMAKKKWAIYHTNTRE